jgi:hypothetical protein
VKQVQLNTIAVREPKRLHVSSSGDTLRFLSLNDGVHRSHSTAPPAHIRVVWFEELKFNKHCSTFVLFDKNVSNLELIRLNRFVS